jgi:hypothetical protein
MPDLTTEEEVVRLAHKMFVDWIEGYDRELQSLYKVPANFDLYTFTPEEFVAARDALHKDGETEPCEWCVLDAMLQAQEELEAQQMQQGAVNGA